MWHDRWLAEFEIRRLRWKLAKMKREALGAKHGPIPACQSETILD
jgi:hypothetical protein